MNFSDEEIRRQMHLGEDSHWEFKEIGFAGNVPRSPRRNDLADELAAFANTDGGVVLCGVTDSGDAQGMSREQMDALERLLVEVCTDMITPPIRPCRPAPRNRQRSAIPVGRSATRAHPARQSRRQLPPGWQLKTPDDKR